MSENSSGRAGSFWAGFEIRRQQLDETLATMGRAPLEACSATCILGTSSFALGPRKTTGNLDRVGRSHDLRMHIDF
jgi:hypothetical protein